MRLRSMLGAGVLLALAATHPVGRAAAQAVAPSAEPLVIGVLNDQSGIYRDTSGPGSTIAIQLAIEDFGGQVLGRPIQLLIGDHQNKPDIGSAIVRDWLDNKHVQAVFDLQVSTVALAALPLLVKANKVAVFSGVASSDFTGKDCTPNSVHWTFDLYAVSRVLPAGLLHQGKRDWYFITPDSAFGQVQQRDIAASVVEQGGRVIGSTPVPLGMVDFSSPILAAQASKADVIVIGSGGQDLQNALKQAREFGIPSKQNIISPNSMIVEVMGLGLEAAAGAYVTESFYWDLDDKTRAWSKRFMSRYGKPANMLQAGNYGGVLHYLKAVQKAGVTDGDAVVRAMKEIPVDDFMTDHGYVREDGRVMRNMYLFQVKTPAESRYPFDDYRLIDTIPAEQAFRPLSKSACPLIKK